MLCWAQRKPGVSCWVLGLFRQPKSPQNPGHVRKCHHEIGIAEISPAPSPPPWHVSCPGAFSGSTLALGQQKSFWGDNMRTRRFSRRRKQPQTGGGGAGLPAPSTSPSLQSCTASPSPSYSLLCSSLGIICSTPHLCLAHAEQGSSSLIFYGCFEGKAQRGKPPRICQCLFS